MTEQHSKEQMKANLRNTINQRKSCGDIGMCEEAPPRATGIPKAWHISAHLINRDKNKIIKGRHIPFIALPNNSNIRSQSVVAMTPAGGSSLDTAKSCLIGGEMQQRPLRPKTTANIALADNSDEL